MVGYEPDTPNGPDVRWQDGEWSIAYWDNTKTDSPCYQVYHNKHYATDAYNVKLHARLECAVVCMTCHVLIPDILVGFYSLVNWER